MKRLIFWEKAEKILEVNKKILVGFHKDFKSLVHC